MWSLFLGGFVPLILASIGWFLVARSASLAARRSEAFSSMSPITSILGDLEEMAESQLHSNLDSELSDDAAANLLRTRQVFSTKSLAKFDLLRSKLSLLSESGVSVSKGSLIELKKSLTLSSIDDISKYKAVLNTTHGINLELQRAFDRAYQKNKKRYNMRAHFVSIFLSKKPGASLN